MAQHRSKITVCVCVCCVCILHSLYLIWAFVALESLQKVFIFLLILLSWVSFASNQWIFWVPGFSTHPLGCLEVDAFSSFVKVRHMLYFYLFFSLKKKKKVLWNTFSKAQSLPPSLRLLCHLILHVSIHYITPISNASQLHACIPQQTSAANEREVVRFHLHHHLYWKKHNYYLSVV